MIGTIEERALWLRAHCGSWQPSTIWGIFETCACEYPSSNIVEFVDGPELTYEDARNRATEMAQALKGFGVRPGECVALKLGNCPQLVISIFALAKIGAIAAFVPPEASDAETRYILDSCNARALFAKKDAEVAKGKGESGELGLLYRQDMALPLENWPWVAWGDLLSLASQAQPWDDSLAHPESVANILFTSGSSGMPKGALLGHDQLLKSAWLNVLNRGFEEGRRILSLVPMNHCFCYVEGLLAILFVGGTLILFPGKYEARNIVEAIARYEASDILSVPYILRKTLDYMAELDRAPVFDSLHAMYCGGERCPDSFWGCLRKGFGIDDIVNGYGMTETCGAVMQTPPESPDEILCRYVGRPLPGNSADLPGFSDRFMEYRIVDKETGEICPAGEPGLLYCRGPLLMRGYCNAEPPFSTDGWFRTGDIGHFGTDGSFALLGREKMSYRINGENVSPEFVESVISNFEGVRRSAVVGVPDAKHGQVGFLFVEFECRSDATINGLRNFCKNNLAHYQIPCYFVEIDAEMWPLTRSGKVAREALGRKARELLASGAAEFFIEKQPKTERK